MIPETWTPHYRLDDGELLGYLRPADDDLVVPVTVFGYPLDEPCEPWAAENVLNDIGLSYLADHWTLQIPEGEIRVVISEASPERLVVANADYHHVVGAPIGKPYTLRVPEDTHRLSR